KAPSRDSVATCGGDVDGMLSSYNTEYSCGDERALVAGVMLGVSMGLHRSSENRIGPCCRSDMHSVVWSDIVKCVGVGLLLVGDVARNYCDDYNPKHPHARWNYHQAPLRCLESASRVLVWRIYV
ncbi:unnamed protein product, partial [Ectocarpus sp. 8 AP-2014]